MGVYHHDTRRKKMKKSFLGLVAVATLFLMASCVTTAEVKQYGLETEETIALNLTKDPNVGVLYVTNVNGEATGATFTPSILPGVGGKSVYVNPLYVKLNGKPIIFTLQCPVVTGYDTNNKPIVQYRQTELRLTKLSDLKAGDVITLKWMYQTQTFAFMDATGNIVQQTIPTFY